MDDQGPAPPPRTKAESGAVARSEDLNPLLPDGTKKRILTGDRTTGKLHLGHYVGSLKNRVRLQGVYDTFILMADVQALTTHYDRPEVLKQSVWDVALDYMAVGLEPYTGGRDDGSQAKIVIQSMVPAIAELTVYYGLLVPMSLLLDNPTTKSEAEQLGAPLEEGIVHAEGQNVHDLDDLGVPSAEVRWHEEQSRQYAIFIGEKFPEIGLPLLSTVRNAIVTLLKSTDVATQQEIQLHRGKNEYQPFYKSEHLARSVRDLLISGKRRTGLRQVNFGFLGYPVSQAADITFVGAHLVPVGEDQVPHIELTREIVRRFNSQYGGGSEILTLPQALIGGGTVKGLDGGAKMSKSLDNAIYLSDDYPEIWRRVSRAVTDPQRVRRHDPGRPEICNIFAYHELFNSDTEPAITAANLSVPSVDDTADLCRTAGIGCVKCKENLAAKLDAFLSPMRERRAEWAKRPDDLRDVLQAGTKRGIEEGEKTLERVQQAMHLDYFT